jgi:hypothetical protein
VRLGIKNVRIAFALAVRGCIGRTVPGPRQAHVRASATAIIRTEGRMIDLSGLAENSAGTG